MAQFRDRYPAGQLDLGQLGSTWEKIEQVWDVALDHAEDSQDLGLTARKFDLSQAAGKRVYIIAWRHLQCAMDNHRALVGLLTSATGATPWAPWNLIRPTFESAFNALWVLEPESGLLRRQRALRLEYLDHKERENFVQELGCMPGKEGKRIRKIAAERSAEVIPIYRAEADALGVPWSRAGDKVNVRDEVGTLKAVTLEAGADSAVLFRSVWRSLSGYQHGLSYAILHGSDVTVLAPIPGGKLVQTETNDENFQMAAQASNYLLVSAITIWIRRSTRPD